MKKVANAIVIAMITLFIALFGILVVYAGSDQINTDKIEVTDYSGRKDTVTVNYRFIVLKDGCVRTRNSTVKNEYNDLRCGVKSFRVIK